MVFVICCVLVAISIITVVMGVCVCVPDVIEVCVTIKLVCACVGVCVCKYM